MTYKNSAFKLNLFSYHFSSLPIFYKNIKEFFTFYNKFNTMSVLKLTIFLFSISSIFSSKILLQESFKDSNYLKSFNLQCSYNDRGCQRHFGLTKLSNSPFLLITLLPSDLPHTQSSDTSPRSELRMKEDIFSPRVTYQITWNVNIQKYSEGFAFCFMQAFNGDKGPNVMIKWIRNRYELWANGKKVILTGTLAEDLHQLSTWRITLHLDPKNGFLQAERKTSKDTGFKNLGKLSGSTMPSNGVNHYLKLGAYSQQEKAQEMHMLVNDLTIVQL